MPDLATAGVVRGLSDPWRRGAKLGGANERRDDPEDEASRGGTRPRRPKIPIRARQAALAKITTRPASGEKSGESSPRRKDEAMDAKPAKIERAATTPANKTCPSCGGRRTAFKDVGFVVIADARCAVGKPGVRLSPSASCAKRRRKGELVKGMRRATMERIERCQASSQAQADKA